MKPRAPGRLMVPSLTISYLSTTTSLMVTALLLVDIGRSFGVPVGIAGQIRTAYSAVSVAAALFMGVLTIRYGHKDLLMTGLLLVAVSGLGCYLSPDFVIMLLSYSTAGFGAAMIRPMCTTIIGEHLPVEKRGIAIGWTMTGMGMAYLIGAPAASFLGDWRLAFVAFSLPIALLGLALALRGLPSPARRSSTSSGSFRNYAQGFREIFANRSAVACLLGTMLLVACIQPIASYFIAFYRQRFLVSAALASIIMIVASLSVILGSLIGGRLVNRLGRKTLTLLVASIAPISVITFVNVPDLWLSQALVYTGCLSYGVGTAGMNSLTLEQVPRFRGSMMSVSQAAWSVGEVLGTALTGLMILLYGYEVAGLSMGALGAVAALVFLLLAVDPTRTPHPGART